MIGNDNNSVLKEKVVLSSTKCGKYGIIFLESKTS